MNNTIEHVHTINPYEFANRFRTELIQDLQMNERYCCPKCVITYIDNDMEGCCYYTEYDGKYELNCVFDYNIHGLFKDTTVDEVNKIWREAVLKEFKKMEEETLFEKWTKIFKQYEK